jgi:formylglycine-generating enzyme
MDFVTIGNPNNAVDTPGVDSNPAGSVAYTYNLGKYEVSRDQINKANAAGSLGIDLENMSSYGGNGVNRPATGVSWNEAARFVNWLNTSKGYQAAYNFTTSGHLDHITLWGAGQYNGSNQYRHKDAYYFLPSSDEWYKGAYGKADGSWSNFPNGTDSPPTAVAGGKTANTAVYGQSMSQGPADVTNAGGLSEYGTMGQGGNVYEWMETCYVHVHEWNAGNYAGSNNTADGVREMRGGSWFTSSSTLEGSLRQSDGPNSGSSWVGFRVASVPEPSSFSLLALGGVVVALRRRKK